MKAILTSTILAEKYIQLVGLINKVSNILGENVLRGHQFSFYIKWQFKRTIPSIKF